MAAAQDPIQLDVFSDVACPWCYIGKRRLERATQELIPDEKVDVRFRAFQLQPDLPADGMPREAFFAQKFGGAAKAREIFARVADEGRTEGIDFDFEQMPKAPNTLLAHRAIALARRQGIAEQLAATEALFSAYFEKAEDVTDPGVVVAVLARAGVEVDPDALDADDPGQDVALDLALAGKIGATGVPLFVADGRFGLTGAQPAEMLAKFLRHARIAREKGEQVVVLPG